MEETQEPQRYPIPTNCLGCNRAMLYYATKPNAAPPKVLCSGCQEQLRPIRIRKTRYGNDTLRS